MTQAFVVTSGSYSDYRIVSVFSSKELATEFMVNSPDGEYNDIGVYEIDRGIEQIRAGLHRYRLSMRFDGSVGTCYLDASAEDLYLSGKPDDLYLYGGVWAEDEQHVVKITSDKRAQLIALGEWRK